MVKTRSGKLFIPGPTDMGIDKLHAEFGTVIDYDANEGYVRLRMSILGWGRGLTMLYPEPAVMLTTIMAWNKAMG